MITEDIIMLDNFHKILQVRLKGKNLSTLSRDLDIPRSVLQGWIHGNRSSSMKNINQVKKLADLLAMTLDELLVGKTAPETLSSISFQDEDRKYQIQISRIK